MAWAGNSWGILILIVLSSDHFWRLGKRLKRVDAQIIVGTIIHMKIGLILNRMPGTWSCEWLNVPQCERAGAILNEEKALSV
jgi:hypothetical protein